MFFSFTTCGGVSIAGGEDDNEVEDSVLKIS